MVITVSLLKNHNPRLHEFFFQAFAALPVDVNSAIKDGIAKNRQQVLYNGWLIKVVSLLRSIFRKSLAGYNVFLWMTRYYYHKI